MYEFEKPSFGLIDWIIKVSWLIVCILIVALIMTACTNPRSIRSSYVKSTAPQKTKNIETDDILNLPVPVKEDSGIEQNYNSSTVVPVANLELNNRKIPTLREQMKIYSEEQAVIKSKVTNIENDLAYLKNSVNELKDIIKDKTIYGSASPGESQETSSKVNNTDEPDLNNSNSNIIESDEVILKKSQLKSNKNKINKFPVVLIPEKKKISSDGSPNITKKKNAVVKNVKDEIRINKQKNKELPKETIVKSIEFENSLSLFKDKNYRDAIASFTKLSINSQDSREISDCYYWIGESHFGLEEYGKSITMFQKVLESNNITKFDNAQNMLAECYYRLGNQSKARNAYQAILDNYPGSVYAPRAKKMLQIL